LFGWTVAEKVAESSITRPETNRSDISMQPAGQQAIPKDHHRVDLSGATLCAPAWAKWPAQSKFLMAPAHRIL
jgi:hypothetical protein